MLYNSVVNYMVRVPEPFLFVNLDPLEAGHTAKGGFLFMKIKKNCKICNKEFNTTSYIEKIGGGRYCSKECMYLGKRKKIKIICEQCGKEFCVIPYRKNSVKYCSRKCLDINRKGKSNHWLKKEKIKKICLICNKEFYIYPSIKSRKYCSKKCNGKAQGLIQLGIKNPAWKGGIIKTICKNCGIEIYKNRPIRSKNNFCSKHCWGIYNYKHNHPRKTGIEIKIENELLKANIDFKTQENIENIRVVDFLLKNKIIIECDGVFWHNLKHQKNKDINQDFVLEFRGYKIFRFLEHEINKNPQKCVEKILQYQRGS